VTVRKISEICCDGCGHKVEWFCKASRPPDWRKLRVIDSAGKQFIFDVCSPRCASKAVDSTYEKDDLLERRHLRAIP
jgi:hypothetical protein